MEKNVSPKLTELIFDAETFGQSVKYAAIINCSFLLYDKERFLDKPYSYDELLAEVFTLKLDVQQQVKDGYRIEPSSIDFWKGLPKEAQLQLVPSKKDLTYAQFCDILIEQLKGHKIDYWWSRSNTFDPILLWRIFEDENRLNDLNNKLKFWKIRDIRTYIDAKTDFKLDKNGFQPLPDSEWKRKFVEHDSKHDIVADVLRIQKIIRLENELSDN